ncbi:MAG: redox-regulated ATPase YchF [Nanoarchaeota archaeon]
MLLGLVGKPSSGKSTFFKAATLAEAEIAPYPFTTIKPNHGIGYVKVECIDKEFGVKCQPAHGFCINGNRFVPVEIMDVAGLVPGASEGKGLGNQFLDDLRQADVFIHIVDASGTTNEEGKPAVNHDPSKDILFLENELNRWFYNIMIKAWKGFVKKIDQEEGGNFSDAIAKQFSGLKVKEEHVKKVLLRLRLPEKPSKWSEDQLFWFASELRTESKPTIIAANKVDIEKARLNYQLLKMRFPGLMVMPCSADSELALREAAKKELIDYIPGEIDFKIKKGLSDEQTEALNKIREFVLLKFQTGTGVQEILNYAVFNFLKYIAVFPAGAHKLADSKGRILPDCFLLPQGSTALDFAYSLHTDFGDNFVKAIDARTKKILGKSYVLKYRDALEIVTR